MPTVETNEAVVSQVRGVPLLREAMPDALSLEEVMNGKQRKSGETHPGPTEHDPFVLKPGGDASNEEDYVCPRCGAEQGSPVVKWPCSRDKTPVYSIDGRLQGFVP